MSTETDKHHTFTIPVAFHVSGRTETEAAYTLVEALAYLGVVGGPYRATPDTQEQIRVLGDEELTGVVESFWTPNHPVADRSDNSGHLVFIKPVIQDGDYEGLPTHIRQALADLAVANYYERLEFESNGKDGGAIR